MPDAAVSFELCEDGCWDEWWATDGHHDDTPALRKTFMRQSAADAGVLGSAQRARSAQIIQGYMGEVPCHYDLVAVDENGRPLVTQYDEEDNEITRAKAWWPSTWMKVPDGR